MDVPNLPSRLTAISFFQNGEKGFAPRPNGPSVFSFRNVNKNGEINGLRATPRNIDAEYKILERIARGIGNNRLASGRIDLFTERRACPSCSPVIQDFRLFYPNIQLNVFTERR